MFRFFVIGVVLSAVFNQGNVINVSDDNTAIKGSDLAGSVDPIVTGMSISDEHKRLWKIQNKKFLKCGLCGEEPQSFPGD